MSLGPKNNGSMSLAILLSVTALSLGTFYAVSKSKETGQAVDEYRSNRAREATQLVGISDLGTIRGLFANTKIGDRYEPAIFPSNYFATTWNLQKNAGIKLPQINLKPNQIELQTYPVGESTLPAATAVFAQNRSPTDFLKVAQNHKIVAMNPDPAHPFYIRSIDVSMDREVSAKDKRRLETIGRITLDAPLPSNLKVFVKAPGATEFSEDLGTAQKPLPAGNYRIQLRGSGVVHFGEVSLDGKNFQVGIANGAITHKANNVEAKDIIIGEFTTDINPPGTTTTEVVTTPVKHEQCTIGGDPADTNTGGTTTTETVTPGAATGIALVAKLYAVDGTVADEVNLTKTLFVGGGSAKTTVITSGRPKPGNLACQDACPLEYNKDYSASLGSMASALDLGVNHEANTRKIDFFDKQKTVGTIGKDAKGIVCANNDLIGQVLKANTGKAPTALLRDDPANFEKMLADNGKFKRFYAYVAPHCIRTLINDREGCGCFAADTKIMMGDKSEKLASEIRRGDLLWNPKLGRAQVVKRVVRGPELVPMFALTIDGNKLLVTGQHPFLTQRGLLPAHKLSVGDQIMDGDKVTSVSAIELQAADKANPPVVWNFELEGGVNPAEHYVLANGVMTGDLYLQENLAGGKDAVARNDQ